MADVLSATGGVAAAEDVRHSACGPVTTDSRRVEPGALFFALRGVRHDGHAFVAEALRKGAMCAIVDHVPAGVSPRSVVCVPDTLTALGDLAAWVRMREPLCVVAVTGSNGKTTTKEMIAAICGAAQFAPPRSGVLKTEGNYNNLIGLPLTLLRRRGDEAVAVLEMGMNRPGEIARLTAIARPDYAVIVNVGQAHLEGVGGLADVAAAKGELFAGLSPEATIAVNADDQWVRRVAASFCGRKVVFGEGGEVRARAVADLGVHGVAFDLQIDGLTTKVRLPLVGRHNVANALAAAAVTHAMGLGLEVIARGLKQTVVPQMRMQVVQLANGVTLINDAYNANPSSMEAALVALRRFSGRPVVVLGDMWELGDESRRAHRTLGERAVRLGVQRLVVLGRWAGTVAEGARAAGLDGEAIRVCASHQAAAQAVAALWQRGDTVLVKGSRSAQMEEVVRLLEGLGKSP